MVIKSNINTIFIAITYSYKRKDKIMRMKNITASIAAAALAAGGVIVVAGNGSGFHGDDLLVFWLNQGYHGICTIKRTKILPLAYPAIIC